MVSLCRLNVTNDQPDITITGFTVRDARFPMSLSLIGSDAMNSAGENALGHITYHTDGDLVGSGFSFSNGQGNEWVRSLNRADHLRVLCAGLKALAPRFVGRTLSSITENFGKTHRELLGGQIRFMSPERGVMQLATCAILNALWDLWAKAEGKPLWRLVADMTPEQFVRCIDFRYITDEVTPEQAVQMLKEKESGKRERLQMALDNKAVPGYNTSVGWLGYSKSTAGGNARAAKLKLSADEQVTELLNQAKAEGFNHFKIKVGLGLEQDRRRLSLIRKVAGPDAVIMVSNTYPSVSLS